MSVPIYQSPAEEKFMNSEKLSTFVVQPCTEQHLFFCSENVNILEIKSCDLSQVN